MQQSGIDSGTTVVLFVGPAVYVVGIMVTNGILTGRGEPYLLWIVNSRLSFSFVATPPLILGGYVDVNTM